MKTRSRTKLPTARVAEGGMTLVETLVSMMLAVLTIAGTVNGYILSTNRAEWSGESLAAHSMAIQRMEQVRSAKWDTAAYPAVDQVTGANFPMVTNVLDLPTSGTNIVTATVRTTITAVSANPPFRLVRVECVWPYQRRGFFTNTLTSYRSPDQ